MFEYMALNLHKYWQGINYGSSKAMGHNNYKLKNGN
jgi:hypothetical protein